VLLNKLGLSFISVQQQYSNGCSWQIYHSAIIQSMAVI